MTRFVLQSLHSVSNKLTPVISNAQEGQALFLVEGVSDSSRYSRDSESAYKNTGTTTISYPYSWLQACLTREELASDQ